MMNLHRNTNVFQMENKQWTMIQKEPVLVDNIFIVETDAQNN